MTVVHFKCNRGNEILFKTEVGKHFVRRATLKEGGG